MRRSFEERMTFCKLKLPIYTYGDILFRLIVHNFVDVTHSIRIGFSLFYRGFKHKQWRTRTYSKGEGKLEELEKNMGGCAADARNYGRCGMWRQ
ncbi:hypothetical protein RE628_21375 [Paenibacillus sp. D2_2]|uniref:hypothetical protein n=1 Tax=Paenibacillus sp. D2_2 TaxID=3073092 RepID=UPI002814B626|nr:hypothetical protein [Paenibacillus sp. D2_2]WMT39881.1 hypothetical protein RE628_21375 [Paenibacillus sp. D2_2]